MLCDFLTFINAFFYSLIAYPALLFVLGYYCYYCRDISATCLQWWPQTNYTDTIISIIFSHYAISSNCLDIKKKKKKAFVWMVDMHVFFSPSDGGVPLRDPVRQLLFRREQTGHAQQGRLCL